MLKIPIDVSNSQVRQTVFLFSATIISIVLNLVVNIVMTKFLGPEGFGDFRFIITILTVFTTIFTFGFYQASARLIVLSNDERCIREHYGASILITVILYFLIIISLSLFFVLDTNIHEKNLFQYLYIVIIFGWVFLVRNHLEATLQASSNIGLLAVSRAFQPLLLLFIIVPLFYFGYFNFSNENVKYALIFNFISFLLVYLFILKRLNLSFKSIKTRLSELFSMNKEFGFNVYIGGVFPLVVASLSELLISYTSTDNIGVGYYSIAVSLCSLISIFPRIIGSVAYKRFSTLDKISKNIILAAIGLGLTSLLFLLIIIKPFVMFFYGEDFITVISLCYILSVGVLFHGMGDLINKYLGANGFGSSLRNSAISVGVVLLLLNLILIPKFQEYGAVTAASISGFFYCGMMYYYYKKSLKNENKGVTK